MQIGNGQGYNRRGSAGGRDNGQNSGVFKSQLSIPISQLDPLTQ